MHHSEPCLYRLAPAPLPASDSLAAHFLSYEFYREVEQRRAFAEYCEWYQQVANQHQEELQQMRQEIDFFGFFGRFY